MWILARHLGHGLLTMAFLGLSVPVLGTNPAADDATFRAAQRAEFASLPPVPDPPTKPGANPIDALLNAWRREHQVAARPTCADHVLIRRLYLDTIGLLPPPEVVAAFEKDAAPEKVARQVAALLADRRGYAEHWITFWADLLRNDEQTNIDNLRKPITRWLFDALRDNKPYDEMVVELLNPGPDGPDGYLKGVNWRGRVNLSQRPPVQAAQNVAQVFLATSIRCASCHDGFTTSWKLKDAYGLAAFFADGPLEMARCDKPTGLVVPARFLYPELGAVDPHADLPTRRAAVARMVTRPRNPRFARVIVNRLWDRLLGRPLAEPLDELGEADCPALLDWLAYDFMKHDFDLKYTIALILTSDAYRQTIDPGTAAKDENATANIGPVPRRLTAEQFLDGLACLTGHWPKPNDLMNVPLEGDHVRAWRHKRPSPLATALGRPNREQVVTKRVQEATVLQALEATNGLTLATLLADGAEALLSSRWGQEPDPAAAIDQLYLRAFARPATAAERALLAPLLGRPSDPRDDRKAGLEDVLWMIVNSPEFQIIH
jgi:hypothetical protein